MMKLPGVVFALEYMLQKGRYGWQYLASYGALRYIPSLMNQSVLMIGKVNLEEHRCHSECVFSRDTKMSPLYCRQTIWDRCTKHHIKICFFICSTCLHRFRTPPFWTRVVFPHFPWHSLFAPLGPWSSSAFFYVIFHPLIRSRSHSH